MSRTHVPAFVCVCLAHVCARRRVLPFITQTEQHSDRVSPVMSTSIEMRRKRSGRENKC